MEEDILEQDGIIEHFHAHMKHMIKTEGWGWYAKIKWEEEKKKADAAAARERHMAKYRNMD